MMSTLFLLAYNARPYLWPQSWATLTKSYLDTTDPISGGHHGL